MSDKDVTRNVRGSGEEGIATPAKRHFQSLHEKGNLTYDKKAGSHDAKRRELLARFKEREQKKRGEGEAAGQVEERGPSSGTDQPSGTEPGSGGPVADEENAS